MSFGEGKPIKKKVGVNYITPSHGEKRLKGQKGKFKK